MKYRNHTLPLLAMTAGALFPSLAAGAPLISIGDHIDVFFEGSAGIQYNTNVFNDPSNEEEDLAFIFSPGLEVSLGRNASGNITLRYFEEIVRYSDLDNIDRNNSNVFLDGSYETARSSFTLSASWQEVTQNTSDVNLQGVLVDREIGQVFGGGEYEITPKTSVRGGIRFIDTQFDDETQLFNDRQSVTVPVTFFYEYSQKLDVGLGYRYRNTDIDADLAGNGEDTRDDHFFNVTFRGELLPKLDGEASLGWQFRDSDNSGSEDSFAADVGLTYAYSEKLSLFLELARDFESGGNANSIEETSAFLQATYIITPRIQAGASVDYSLADYQSGREDDIYSGGLNLGYTYNEYLRFSGGYIYQNVDSNLNAAEFEGHQFSLTATLRY